MSEEPAIKKGMKERENKRFLYPAIFTIILKSLKNRKINSTKPLKPLRKFKILSFRGVFLKNLGFL
ncbi:hypothetical protein VN1213_09450 [Helicobacter pylori]|nr:hypothetical protein VN1213_09450 [Helicobacter pylori]